ncbi:cytochrome o ubiquinol oxidase subunit IV [Dyella sp. LX-66]|uniref:cytochrome o ubiquinol oxidase subunit IV n=1 Tax=unclassified Dyella TaxID=2634549 RepID=UPI001BE0113E|nr:cytochrome o ubiquinol oxidase subunit IV [Dyella sp. LX-1]MBT2138851.1 cytochrome o ubiquinol oxidase subunit IV [Dyella sp. LX-66]
MSAHTDVHAGHGHDEHGHGEHHEHDDGIGHVSLKGYMIGFVLAVLLTAVPFGLVMSGGLKDPSATAFVILGFAAVQIVVHMVYFLHMNAKSEGGWNMLALIFTAVLVLITLSGSIWVMYHLNHNMMPALMDPRNLP